jgi:hypothetical protein
MAGCVQIGKESVQHSFMAGHGTVGATEVPLTSMPFSVLKHIVIRAMTGNTGLIYVGPVGHASDGFELAEGEQTPPIYVDDTSKIALIGSDADQDFSWVAN